LGEEAGGAEFVKVFVFGLLAAAFAVAPALANEPQFGQWAADPQSCSGAASLTVTATTLRRSDESCTIGKMYKADRALYIEGRCSSGGAVTRHPITLQMKGERLAVTWNGERLQEMQRCR
jgi:hypothetical protein